jgi:acetylornithine deacetylase
MNSSVVGLLATMIQQESIYSAMCGRADAERPLAEMLEREAQAFGLRTRRLPVARRGFNLLISYEANSDGPWLLFESHMDTVGVEGMIGDPFSGKIEGNKIFGRGACDTKGSGAAMLWALKTHAANRGATNAAVLFTIDEEHMKAGIKAFVDDQLPSLPWRPAATIVGEPTMLQPVIAHNGVVRWTIRTMGVAAHSSDPTRGRSAISMMLRVIEAL